jgi:hypothetical protein
MQDSRFGHIGIWFASCLGIIGATGAGLWNVVPCECRAISKYEDSRVIDIAYQDFRTLIVRNDATKAIVERDGFMLVDQEILELKIDFGDDKRPILNALFGKSKSNVKASKRLIVGLNDANAGADKLVILQNSRITPQEVSVESNSEYRCGDILKYVATLNARPVDAATSVRVAIEIEISKPLSPFLHSIAQTRLDRQVKESVDKQVIAINEFVQEHRRR